MRSDRHFEARRLRVTLRRLRARLLLIARRERLRVARQIRLWRLRWRLRRVARLVLAHERLAVVFVVEVVVGRTLRSALARLRLRIVIRVLLAELLLRSGDQAKIMLGVLIVVFRRHRIARALRIARELDVFLRDVRGRAADLDVGSVRLIDASQRILAFAVLVVASPHALLTVSHHLPFRQPFTFTAAYAAPRSSNLHALTHVHTAPTSYSARTKPAPVASMNARTFAIFIALAAATP